MSSDFYDRVGSLALGSRLRRVSERLTDEARSVYEMYDVGLEPRWFPVFRTLADEDELSTSDLAERIGQTHASVSQTTSAMLEAGLVTTVRSDSDARVNVISLSPAGRRLVPGLLEQSDDVSAAVEELLKQSARSLWAALEEFEERLGERSLLDRVKDQRRRREADRVRIVDYRPEHADVFRDLNLAWIDQHFSVEETDRLLLDEPEERILSPGGAILMAEYGGEVVGTVALLPMDDGRLELVKMAVDPKARGKGLGLLLGEAALARARALGAERVYLESNTLLGPAISLYRKLGFRRVYDRVSPYARCNIQMEIDIAIGPPPA